MVPTSDPTRCGTGGAADRGFTLLELIVVVSLISIMFFFAVPKFANTAFSDARFRTARWIVQRAGDLRAEAVEKGASRFLVVDLDEGRLWAATSSPAAENGRSEDGPTGYRMPQGLEITRVVFTDGTSVTAGRAMIRFSADGVASGAVIAIAKAGREVMSLEIEPFLPEVRVRDGGA
ncbi:MAG: prepilin-type N-terminal cleavage/methylation domain-containing protein [Pseudomonadota bacterium]